MTESGDGNANFARLAWLRALQRTAGIERNPGVTLPLLIEHMALRLGDAPALLARDGCLSYRALAARANQYARFGVDSGLRAGDTSALLMGNCAEYLAIWLGLTRLGVSVALLNSHLSGEALAHSIGIVEPKLLITDADLAASLGAIRPRLQPALKVVVAGVQASDFAPLRLAQYKDEPLSAAEAPLPTLDMTALQIYTSGTTGLPKAANVSHYRLMQWSNWFAGLLDTTPADRMYNCLPLYHSVGGVVATGATLLGGGAVVIRRRFSASEFWRDVREERCTLFQYIGELCRYLVNQPRESGEGEHQLRIACGNGLRLDVWNEFKARFHIPRILEYYAATEGNFSLYNCEGEPGAIGRIPPFLAHRLPVALVQFDVVAGEPARDEEGRCRRCGVDEVGEAIGLIPDEKTARAGRFEGYSDAQASKRKVLNDVFKPGDAWYRTGDLMRRDARGFYYFVDRVGDTYRWKGENVSAAEVHTVLAGAPGVLDAVVYGVPVPGADGRAGMAALVVTNDFDLAAFRHHVRKHLPAYARPVFVRLLTDAIAATGTFKPLKQELTQAGFDPRLVRDRLYADDPRLGAYVPVDQSVVADIQSGRRRL